MTAAKTNRVTNVQVPGEAPKAEQESAAREEQDQGHATSAPSDALDIDALRAQIREEERANARAELGEQIQAASTVIASPAAAPKSKGAYAKMRAADVDPATLTAPVLTLDGYVCPLPPTATK